MASYSTPWPLPPSFIPSDPTVRSSASMKPAKEDSPPAEKGVADGVLHITIHQAKQVHNICIYGDQDVYAKFLFAHRQDAVYPMQPVRAGGQNPIFNQSLEIPISMQRDTVLKCELWMMSCARSYLEDQLLGFALVPLQTLYGRGKQTCEYCLTSTDVFFTPAGTVQLSLALFDHNSARIAAAGGMVLAGEVERPFGPPSPDFQEVMMDCGQLCGTTANLCKVEFPDLQAASEDQHLVSMYYKLATTAAAGGSAFEESNESGSSSILSGNANSGECGKAGGRHGDPSENDRHYAPVSEVHDVSMASAPLLHVHASSVSSVDDEMLPSPREVECANRPMYFSGFGQPSGACGTVMPVEVGLGEQPIMPISSAGADCRSSPSPPSARMKEKQEGEDKPANPESEAPVTREHFVDLYLKSMQQFTDKLADMKFSFNIDAKDLAALRSVQVDKVADGRKKEGSKLYYGSRAFY